MGVPPTPAHPPASSSSSLLLEPLSPQLFVPTPGFLDPVGTHPGPVTFVMKGARCSKVVGYLIRMNIPHVTPQ